MISDSGLVWSMNWDSCEDPKNSRTAAAAGFALIRSCGMTVSISIDDMRSLMARSIRNRPMRYWFSIKLTDRTHPAVAEVVDIIDGTDAVTQFHERLHDRKNVFLAQNTNRVLDIEFEARIHLHATNRRQVVALAVEEQRGEHVLGGFKRRRFAGTHHPIDVEQRILTRLVFVGRQRGANIGTNVDVVDVENLDLVISQIHQINERSGGFAGLFVDLIGQLVTGFEIDFAGFHVDDIFGNIAAVNGFRLDADFLHPAGEILHGACGDLFTGFDDNLSRLFASMMSSTGLEPLMRSASNGIDQPFFLSRFSVRRL